MLKENRYKVLKMTCNGCANSIQSLLNHTNGIIDAKVNFTEKEVEIMFDETIISELNIQKTVQTIGYDLVLENLNA